MPALDGSAGEFRRFFRREVPVGGGSVVKVRYGAGNAQDAVEGARTHVETRHALAKLLKAFVIGPRVLAEQTRSYLCIALDSFLILVAGFLNGTRRHDTPAYFRRRLRGLRGGHVIEIHRLDLALDVDTVEQRP